MSPAAAAPPADRAAYAAAQRTCLSRGSRWKPAVHRVETAAGVWIAKDCAELRGLGRLVARWLLARERRALRRLAGVDGVPHWLADLDSQAFFCARLEGAPLDRERFQAHPRALAEQLRGRVLALHEKRVYHLDLRQRQNLLVADDGTLQVVDFGAAAAPGPVGERLFGALLRWVDRQAVLKYLARYAPAELRRDEAEAVVRGARWRRLWFLSPHRDRGAVTAARARLADDDAAASD